VVKSFTYGSEMYINRHSAAIPMRRECSKTSTDQFAFHTRNCLRPVYRAKVVKVPELKGINSIVLLRPYNAADSIEASASRLSSLPTTIQCPCESVANAPSPAYFSRFTFITGWMMTEFRHRGSSCVGWTGYENNILRHHHHAGTNST